MAQIKEQLVKTNEQFNSGLFAATAAKDANGIIRPINSDPGDEWCE